VENLTGTSTGDQGVSGNTLDNEISMAGGNDLIVVEQGGNDTVNGGGGDDFAYFGNAYTSADVFNGGAGYDTLALLGNYDVTLGTLTSVEKLSVFTGGAAGPFNYTIRTIDSNVDAGATLFVFAGSLAANEKLTFDGSAETNGRLNVIGGRADDSIIGGAKGDYLVGGQGADVLTGGGGRDFFAYTATADSTFAKSDTITDFTKLDKIDLTQIDADGNAANGNSAFTFIGSGNFTGKAGELRAFEAVAGKWFVVGDTDGDGNGDIVIQVTVIDNQPIVASDFFL
jgi:Ca2+-binding RTX toxin-like protein